MIQRVSAMGHGPWGGDCYWLSSLDGVESNHLYVIYDENGLISDRRLAWQGTGFRRHLCSAVHQLNENWTSKFAAYLTAVAINHTDFLMFITRW